MTDPMPGLQPGDGSLTDLTFRSVAWTALDTGSQILLKILAILVLARLLKPQDFGLVNAALVVIGFSAIFSQCGIGLALIQRKELRREHVETAFSFTVLAGAAFAAGVYIFRGPLAGFFKMEGLPPVIGWLSLLLFMNGLASVPDALLQRSLRFRTLAMVHVSSIFFGYGLCGIGGALAGWGMRALILAEAAQAGLRVLLLLLIQPHARAFRMEGRAFRELFRFGGGMTLVSLPNYIAQQGDYFVTGRWLGAGDLGLYSRAYQFMVLPATFFAGAAEKVLFPTMSRVQEESTRLSIAYRRGEALLAILALPGSVIASILAPELIQVLLGPGWSGAVVPFRILALGMFFRMAYKLGYTVARAKGDVYGIFWRQVVYAILVVGGALWGQRYGLAGVAWAVLIALAGQFFLSMQQAVRLANIRWSDATVPLLPALMLAVLCGGLAWIVASPCRGANLAAVWVVLISAGVATGAAGLLALARPTWVLGEEGLWWKAVLTSYIHTLRGRNSPKP
ncbi:MAG: lipopolysaccharide biosynthesis protein [Planctomycetota bacterium]